LSIFTLQTFKPIKQPPHDSRKLFKPMPATLDPHRPPSA